MQTDENTEPVSLGSLQEQKKQEDQEIEYVMKMKDDMFEIANMQCKQRLLADKLYEYFETFIKPNSSLKPINQGFVDEVEEFGKLAEVVRSKLERTIAETQQFKSVLVSRKKVCESNHSKFLKICSAVKDTRDRKRKLEQKLQQEAAQKISSAEIRVQEKKEEEEEEEEEGKTIEDFMDAAMFAEVYKKMCQTRERNEDRIDDYKQLLQQIEAFLGLASKMTANNNYYTQLFDAHKKVLSKVHQNIANKESQVKNNSGNQGTSIEAEDAILLASFWDSVKGCIIKCELKFDSGGDSEGESEGHSKTNTEIKRDQGSEESK